MSDDLLREATRAVRETTEHSGGNGAFTRMRIMHSLHGARRRRMTRLIVWAPLAAILAGATAAAATGQAARVWLAIERAVVSDRTDTDTRTPPPTARKTRPSARGPHKAPPPEPAPSALAARRYTPAPSASEPESPTPAADEIASSLARSKDRPLSLLRRAPKPSSGGTTPAPSDADAAAERELDLYRAAHRAHFRDHDCQGAVLAWERYLAQAPRGRFTLEARYNRALCLVRLGREGEAAAALRPFAGGSLGGYRQADARALLDALESKDSGAE
jgi:hypothetical protein